MLTNFSGDPGLSHSFTGLRATVSEQAKIIIHVFPEYTPHDATRHLEQLFSLADRVLGADLYDRLNVAELSLLAFALYSHDWGMAISHEERAAISGLRTSQNMVLIPDEQRGYQHFRDEGIRLGESDERIWENYLRLTHAQRSGCRLRKELLPLGQSFAEMVARVAEGHALDIREIRDPERYPLHTALFGQVANVAAVTTYLRLVDLLDLSEDRTPFALWSIVRPQNAISATEWNKHRALAPVAVSEQPNNRQVLISGATDEPEVFAALADLRSWVDAQFVESVGFLRHIGKQYDLKLDSAIRWDVKAVGFEPVLLRFDFDRSAALGLLSKEIYGHERLTFVRELLQNSVDAIETRVELLRQSHTQLEGRISIDITTFPDLIRVAWTDNGVGMDRQVLESYFAKIGRSWYQSTDFKRNSLDCDPISKFGVGILSCFGVSRSLTVTTKREPLLARDPHGWRVRIPVLDGHFRVKVEDQVPVGTTIVLEINQPSALLNAARIAAAIKRTASLVGFRIALTVDGFSELIEPVSQNDDPRLPFVQISSVDESALAALQSLTTQLKHRYSSPDGGYEAFFSCLFPGDLSSITALRRTEWSFGSKRIDLDDFIIEKPTRLFLKGVATDIEGKNHSSDIPSSVTLNILKPSLVRPDLARSHIDTAAVNLNGLWRDIASHLRETIGPHSPSIDSRVRSLSVASGIGQVPDEALAHLVPPDDWPVWSLEDGSGLVWRDASFVFGSDEIVEAPHELHYVLGNEQYAQRARKSASRWSGPSCFVALSRHSGLLWGAATSLVRTLLGMRGFVPIELRLVSSPTNDDVPLACQVWQKNPKHARPPQNLDVFELLSEWRKDPMLECPEIIGRALFSRRSAGAAPLLVRFPEGMQDVAAIGSLYWNQNNTKIRALVELLLELSARSRRGTLSGRGQQVFEHVNGTSYLGYIVPARHSSVRAAIDRYRELVSVAKQAGLPAPDPLGLRDVLSGSVGEYWNPYHYPIWSWPESYRPVGAAWSVEKL